MSRAGWSKDNESGGTVDHEGYGESLLHSKFEPLFLPPFCSGREVIKVLGGDPSGNPEEYDQENIDHIRRVAAYNKCHLVQEHADSKSAKSLKNWVMHRRDDAGKEG